MSAISVPKGLSFSQRGYLDALADGMSIAQLARAVDRDHSATARMLLKLRRKGYVTFGPSEDDDRCVLVHRTAKATR